MIDALIEEGACSAPCLLDYGVTKWNACTNCTYNPIGRKSGNRYKSGGPIPFPNGQTCPMCNGAGRIGDEQTEEIHMMVIWDYDSWINVGGQDRTTQTPGGFAQTISDITTYAKIKRAKTVLLNTDVSNYEKHRFQRDGEPNLCGIGEQYVITMWERMS